MSEGRLGRVVAATVSTPSFDLTVAAYSRYLGYVVREEGALPAPLAASWAAPAAAGARFALLSPANGKKVYIRLVDGPHPPTYAALRTFGWAALELSVADVDALAADMRDSPFALIGPPRDIALGATTIRAMQVRGPANEILILTQIKQSAPGSDLPVAKAGVDQLFIAILACGDFDRAKDFYGNKFLMPAGPDVQVPILTLNEAFGLDRPTKHRMATIGLPGQSLIELDQYPDGATRRAAAPGYLPPGVALVTFEAAGAFDDLPIYWLSEPVAYDALPYEGRRHITLYGGAGEMIEMIETV